GMTPLFFQHFWQLIKVFFSKNASVGLKAEICQCLQGIEVCHSSRYLGLPLGIGKNKRE
ncbi:Unknown protein, partial [Striga hermonthica]